MNEQADTTLAPEASSSPSTSSPSSTNGKMPKFVNGGDNFELLSSIPAEEVPGEGPIVEIEEKTDGLQRENEGQEGEKGQEEVESSPENQEKETKEKPPSPISKAKVGDSEIEVSDDAVFTFKASKGEVSVPLKELKASYQSMHERDRLFGQFNKEKTKWEKERDIVENRFSELASEAETNPWAVMNKMCSLYGKNPAKVLPVYLAQAQKTLLDLEKLPEEERRIVFQRMGLQWDEEQLEKKKNIEKEKENVKKDEEYLNQLCKDNGISEEELTKAWSLLSETPGIDLDKKSRRETIDLVTGYITQFERPYVKIESALAKVDLGSIDEKEVLEIKKTLRTLITPSDTEDDVAEIIRVYLGKEDIPNAPKAKAEEQSPKEPLRKTESKSTPKKVYQVKEKPKQAEDEDDVFDLDELVQSYRR